MRASRAVEELVLVSARYNRTKWGLIRLYIRGMKLLFSAGLKTVSLRKLAEFSGRSAGVRWKSAWLPRVLAQVDGLLGVQSSPEHRKCLLRSLLFHHCLGRMGMASVLNIGLAGDHQQIGHAWVTVDGEALLDDGHERFPVFLFDDGSVRYWYSDPLTDPSVSERNVSAAAES
jgi:hypothetical protein